MKDRTNKKSISRKITRGVAYVALVAMMIVTIVFSVALFRIRKDMIDSDTRMGSTAENLSSESRREQNTQRMLEAAVGKADLADNIFKNFEKNVQAIADATAMLYEDDYPKRDIPIPDPKEDGKLSVQLLFSEHTDKDSVDTISEVKLLGNIQDMLLAINSNDDNMVSDYVATETGIMVQADYISGSKFDENGDVLPYEADTRPWYIGAKEKGSPFFTEVSQDAHTSRIGIMCGVPVFSGKELKGVAGAGMYLDNVESIVKDIEIGENSDACVINQNGRIIFSTRTEGELVTGIDGIDLRKSENIELSGVISQAVSQDTGISVINIDGEEYYVSFAPMETVGWSFMILLPKSEVEAPTLQLLDGIGALTEESVGNIDVKIKYTYRMLIIVILVIGFTVLMVAFRLSALIVRPIKKLTERVSGITGDHLDFMWDEATGDETQLLAESFGSLTKRVKDYIKEVQTVTAEKERIGTELSLATRIQADMLPNIYPAFPERSEFDIYATMTPAKEVGGDFYDFFLVDDDHLCMVMADVSGKGVPAALFMMASKIILANNAMLGKSPAQILSDTNAAICANNREEMFVTVWLGILEISTGKITAANAGHEYPAIRYADGNFELYKDKHGFVIGGMEGVKYKEYELQLAYGARLFVYTDGVAEATNAENELFGTDRMIEALNINPGVKPKEILSNVRSAVDGFVKEAEQFDDLTMLCMEYIGNPDKEGQADGE